MKSNLFRAILLTLTLGLLTLQGQAQVDLSNLPKHPRLLLQKGEEKQLLKNIKASPEWTTIHNNLLEECDRIIDLPTNERKKLGMRLLSVSRENLRRIFMLSYAYRTTGEQKYLERAEAEMLKAASFKDWNPYHFLDVGEMSMALGIGYDWLYYDLSEESKQTIKEAIIELGLKPSFDTRPLAHQDRPYNWFLDCNHNWNQVCNGGITFGALAVAEDIPELATEVINRAIETIKLPMEVYAPCGAYPEGVGYWAYGTQFNALFLAALEGALHSDFGLQEMPGFMQTGYFALQMVSPCGRQFNYMDNHEKPLVSSTPFFFYDQLDDPSLIYIQAKLLTEGPKEAYLDYRALPALIIWGSNTSLSNPTPPSQNFYLGDGENPVCAMRSTWGDPDAHFLGVKLGSPSINHGHMDAGSFIFEADGVRWAIDLGPEHYGETEALGVDLWTNTQSSQRWDVFRYNNRAHNTLTFNDKYQYIAAKSEIEEYSDDPKQFFVRTDLSGVYKDQVRSAERSMSLVGGDYAVIEDKVSSGEFYTRMRWNLMTKASVKQISEKVVELSQDGKTCLIKVECELPIRWSFDKTPAVNTFDTPNPEVTMVGFDCDLPLESESFFQVFLMPSGEADTSNFQSVLNK